MLRPAAVESAQGSKFLPVPVDRAGQTYQLDYRFSLESLGCDEARDQSYPRIKVESSTVVISEQSVPICDPAADIRVRSVKCLFLWKCSLRTP